MEHQVKQALVVYNPKCTNIQYLDEVLGCLARRLCQAEMINVRIVPMQENGLTCLLFNYEPLDLIVVVGGDATVRAVLESLAQTKMKTPVGIVPLGSETLLASKLGIHTCNSRLETEAAVRTIVTGRTIAMDLGRVNGRYFAIDAVIGNIPPAVLAPEAQMSRHFGVLAHLSTFVQTVGKRSMVCRFLLEGGGFYRLAHSIFVTNARGVAGYELSGDGLMRLSGPPGRERFPGRSKRGGGAAAQSPGNREAGASQDFIDSAAAGGAGAIDTSSIDELSDGSLYLCIVNPLSLGDYGRLAYRFGAWYLSGAVSGEAPLLIRKIQHVRIEIEEPAPMMVDGEVWGTTPVDIDVVPGAVNVIVPAKPAPPVYSVDHSTARDGHESDAALSTVPKL